jgi:phage protein D
MPQQAEYVAHVGIKVDGQNLPERLMDDLIELVVDTTLDMPGMFTLRFHDPELQLIQGDTFDIGKAVEIKLTPGDSSLERVLAGEITGLEPDYAPDMAVTLVVRGFDRGHRLTREKKSKTFVQMSDSDIVSQVASGAGLQAQVDSTPGSHEHVFQHNQTDWEFLLERAARLGYQMFVDDRTLHFSKPPTSEELTLEWGQTLPSFKPRLVSTGQVNEVTVRGWDPATKKEIIGKATSSSLPPRIGLGKHGADLAKQKFSSAKHVVVDQPIDSQAEADRMAQAILDEINAGSIVAEGIADGNAKLIAGKMVKIEGVGSRFNGKYLVASAVHYYTADGYQVHFRVEGVRPKLMSEMMSGEPAAQSDSGWTGVVSAIVTNNNDPQGLNRIKVKFPWFADQLESDWVRMVGLGAGDGRGLYWVPEVNDEVLVAFEHGDFNYPYVLGNLWNGKDKPPDSISNVVKNGNVETRMLKTRAGHVVKLVDDSSGQYIEITDGQGKHQIKLDVQGNKLIIKTQGDVNIESQGKTTISATGQLDIKGQSNVNIEATGQLVLKGATVNIN